MEKETFTEVDFKAFKDNLHKGIVEFKYIKKDGSIREAKGTLNIDIMGSENAPKGSLNNTSDKTTRYYDLNSNGWRSFITDNLIEINTKC